MRFDLRLDGLHDIRPAEVDFLRWRRGRWIQHTTKHYPATLSEVWKAAKVQEILDTLSEPTLIHIQYRSFTRMWILRNGMCL